jgi:hypothetical protein
MSGLAQAEELKATNPSGQEGGAPSREVCRKLVRYVPPADLAYKPGIDVKGRPVKPADLPESADYAKIVPETVEFNAAVNPVNYQARNSLAQQKADKQAAIVANDQAKKAAQTQVTSLTAQQNTLNATAATLAAQKVALDNTLAGLQLEVDNGTRTKVNSTYVEAIAAVAAKQSQINANTSSLAAVATSLAAQQAIVNAAPTTDAQLRMDQIGIEGKQSALSAKGLDATTMNVAAIRYDIAKDQLLLNGKPLASPELEALSEACAKANYK